jgi:hypothetical protein
MFTIMLQACVLAPVAFGTPRLFTVVFPLFWASVIAMLLSSMTRKIAPRIHSSKDGIAASLVAIILFF